MDRSRIVLGTLLDTGSLAGNFISAAAVRRSRIESYTTTDLKSVCSGLDNKCLTLIKSIDLFVHFPCHGDVTITHSFRLKFFILENAPIRLIIGRDSIKEYDLFLYVPSQITVPSIQSRGDDTLSPRRTDVLCRSCTCSKDSRPLEHAVISQPTVMRYIPEDSGQQTVCDILLSLILGKAKFSVYFNKVVVKSYKRRAKANSYIQMLHNLNWRWPMKCDI